jgi:hypothetical protein
MTYIKQLGRPRRIGLRPQVAGRKKTCVYEYAGFFYYKFLGGPGRNRTTDTRIFNPSKMPFIVVD